MNILSLDGVSKTLVDAPLFDQVTLGIDAGDKIGFIGRNGAGKSTFLKILTGELPPDAGTVSRNRSLTMSILPQRPFFHPGTTLEEYCFQENAGLAVSAAAPGAEGAEGAEEHAAVADAYRSLCRELGLTDLSARMETLSGGMLRKASMAACLARRANFLLLDEPTNHLDLDTIEWLEGRLGSVSFGFILVTHDRYFLDGVCTAIMEIDGHEVRKYAGNYSVYLERKAEREEVRQKDEQRRATILRREAEWLKRGPRARTGKDKGRKQRIQDLLDSHVQAEMTMREFTSAHRRLGKKVLEMHEAAKSWDGWQVLRPFTYSFRRGERIGVIGPNGSGKTTFLKLAAGEVEPDSGRVTRGETTVFAHLPQAGGEARRNVTVIDFMRELAERVPQERGGSLSAEQFLERFLFPRSMHGVTLDRLSGGELRRLTLARLLATAPNFLLLDEPTNDLDLDTIRLLEDYLADFSGCILLVSHDRALLDRLTDSLLVFDGQGGARGFVGTYEEYREAAQEEAARAAGIARDAGAGREPPQQPARAEDRTEKARLSFKERKEYEGLLAEIEALEKEQKVLEAAFQEKPDQPMDPETRAKNARRYQEVLRTIDERMARWEELASRAE
ncbi:MAG TPA: ABC-F family ATP-binding cassette domain-containing protein [Spirochaetia bacterium]|nr:ABC-F family ATP-binding cassette domain-containing protein [Spirochaetia bacterium]